MLSTHTMVEICFTSEVTKQQAQLIIPRELWPRVLGTT
jgi:hypothetical protein